MLSAHPFTAGIEKSVLVRMAAYAHEVTFAPDQVVFGAGERSLHFGLLLSGSACVELSTPFYGMTIQILSAGDAFGWSALLDENSTVFQVRARETTRALCFDGRRLARACARDRRLSAVVYRHLAEVLAKRVRAVELRLEEFAGSPDRCHERGTLPSPGEHTTPAAL